MSRKIIIQDQVMDSSDFQINYVFWLSVPVSRQSVLAKGASATSTVRDATPEEIDDIQQGRVIELVGTLGVIKSGNLNDVKNKLIAVYKAKQTELENKNPFKYYGSSWDGTTWIAGGLQ